MTIHLEFANIIMIGHLWTLPLWALLTKVPATKAKGVIILESANLMVAFSATLLLLTYLWTLLSLLWTNDPTTKFMLANRYLGPYWAVNLMGILLVGVLPLLLWKKRWRLSPRIALAVWLGLWGEKVSRVLIFMFAIQTLDFHPSLLPWMGVEWFIYLAVLSMVSLILWRLGENVSV
jgi:hypothetical protein